MDSLKDIMIFIGAIAGYLVVVKWVLPKLGVPT
jgi:hypothetical protein